MKMNAPLSTAMMCTSSGKSARICAGQFGDALSESVLQLMRTSGRVGDRA